MGREGTLINASKALDLRDSQHLTRRYLLSLVRNLSAFLVNGVDGKGVAIATAQSVLHPLFFMQFQARTLAPSTRPCRRAYRSLLDDVTGAEEAETLTAAAIYILGWRPWPQVVLGTETPL